MKNTTRTVTVAIFTILAIFTLTGVLVALQMTAKFVSPSNVQKLAQKSVVADKGMATEEQALHEASSPMAAREITESEIIVPPEPPMQPTAGKTAADVEQRIIKNGFLDLIVNNVNEATDKIIQHSEQAGGFVQNSSISEREDGTHIGSMTVRVPVDRFQETMESLKQLANTVETERITGQDVTEQYTDLEARLRNAKAQENTYIELLDQAEDVEDILAIQRELNNIRSEIEYLQGRVQSLQNQTSFATIQLNLSEEPRVQAPTKEFRPLASFREAGQALVNLAQQLLVGGIWIIVVGGGILLPLLIIGWIIYRIVNAIKHNT